MVGCCCGPGQHDGDDDGRWSLYCIGMHACREVYDRASPGYRGRCTAPMVIDKKTKTIVSMCLRVDV